MKCRPLRRYMVLCLKRLSEIHQLLAQLTSNSLTNICRICISNSQTNMYNSPNVFCTRDNFYYFHYHGMFAAILTCMSYETHASIPYTFGRSQQAWCLNLLDLFPPCKLRSDPYSSANTVITNKPYFYSRYDFCIFKYFTFSQQQSSRPILFVYLNISHLEV